MYSYRNFLVLLTSLLIVSACHIRPLYYTSKDQKHADSKSYLQVNAINERLGQELRNMLLERLHFIETLSTPVNISVGLIITKTGIGYNPDLSSTLERITLETKTSLSSKKFSKIFTSEKSDIVTIPISTYASLVNEEDIKRKVLREIANDIIQRIALLQKDLT